MPTHDKLGREYARLDGLKAGDMVHADGDFPCMRGNYTVRSDGVGSLYVECDYNTHYLDGQDDGNGSLVGFYKV
jgi:hypothetical protein